MAGTGRAGTAAASHGAADWVGAASTAGTAGPMVRGNAGMAMATGMAAVAAIASESIPVPHAAEALLTRAPAAAKQRAHASTATRACAARAMRVCAATRVREAKAKH